MHYQRQQKYGMTGSAAPLLAPRSATCSIEGCDKKTNARDLCAAHYDRARKTGNPGSPQVRYRGTADRICDLCDKPHLARGLCAIHYAQQPDRLAYGAEKSRRRRARQILQAVVWPLPVEAIQARMDYFGNVCHLCGEPEANTVDHVKPLAVGGPHIVANLRPAHRACNSSKGATWGGVAAYG
jgi:5-methylcytosine-specific restriction endonuclease McrA